MEPSYFLQQMTNGLVLGSMYALVAIGFSLIYSILRLVNFAHGDVLTIGAFAGLFMLVILKLPFWSAVIAVALLGLLVGVAIERVAFRPIREAPQVTGFITSLAISSILQNVGIITLTAQPRTFRIPEWLGKVNLVGGVAFRNIDMFIVGLTVGLLVALSLWVKRTKTGMAMRAVAENLAVARLMGINVNRIVMMSFALGSALATLAGMMWAAKYGQIDPLMGFVPGLKAFVAAVIGGVGSLPGAIMGGYLLGISEVFFVGMLPPEYGSYRDAFVFGLLLVLLLIRPSGISGRAQEGV